MEITESSIQNNRELFMGYLVDIDRKGMSDLLDWLEFNSDFFTSPASAKYHLSVEGGLVTHSLNVFYELTALCRHYAPGEYSPDTIAIVALLHDVCKAKCYVRGKRWTKVDGNWVQYDTYEFKEDFVFGHGEKSVYIVNQFVTLTREEAQAIRFHMGAWQDGEKQNAGNVFRTNKLALLLHMADEIATFIDEKEM